ncbi:MAG TPA: hypothetical protein ACFYEK_02290 [Candidatus Wunengus sp. YC60]|uniref:hypothetical protein n=1 Tax=Candidatus Wunengus sp. YC60 TaxID=3367697 RepID=UPI0040251F3C
MVKGLITSAIKKVTLELIYQVVNERTEEIITKIDEVKKRQEDDFRYLVQKIDTDIGNVRGELGQLRNEVKSEIGSVRTEIGQLRSEMKSEIGSVRGEIAQLRNEISQLNQRIDTIIQMLMNLKNN